MRLVRKVLGAILRPIYKGFFERPLWWFLARVKAFFLAEIGPRIEGNEHRLAVIEERLRSTEANNAAQWNALEQLLLGLFRQPIEGSGSCDKCGAQQNDLIGSLAGQDQIHERHNLR
jgi:hypothetical protein